MPKNKKPSRKSNEKSSHKNITIVQSKSDQIPEDNLSYATLVSIDETKSLGSGFRIKFQGLNYLITAKHVLFDRHGNLYGENLVLTFHSPERNHSKPWIFQINLNEATIIQSKGFDVTGVLLGENIPIEEHDHKSPLKKLPATAAKRPTSFVPESYVHNIQLGDGFVVSLDVEAVGSFKETSLANDVYLTGYPTSLGIRSNEYYDFTKPLVRKGIVAGIYEKRSTFVIDCPSYPGNSGGPVVEKCKDGLFRVTGVVSKYIPYETRWHSNRGDIVNVDISNSGYTVCVSMDVVLSMLEENIQSHLSNKKNKNPTDSSQFTHG